MHPQTQGQVWEPLLVREKEGRGPSVDFICIIIYCLCWVVVKYSGYLEHMDKPFDSNCFRKTPRLMKLGEGISASQGVGRRGVCGFLGVSLCGGRGRSPNAVFLELFLFVPSLRLGVDQAVTSSLMFAPTSPRLGGFGAQPWPGYLGI